MSESSTLPATDDPDGGSDRPEFEVRMRGASIGYRRYQVIAFDKGFLLLDLGRVKAQQGEGAPFLIGAALGGMVGAAVGSALEGAMESAGVDSDSDYSHYSDDQLIELARSRKHSIVAPYDDIVSASIDLPGVMNRISQGRSLVGWITIREKTLGKLKLEVRDLSSMLRAVHVLPQRLGDRAKVNVEFDQQNCVFVRRRDQTCSGALPHTPAQV